MLQLLLKQGMFFDDYIINFIYDIKPNMCQYNASIYWKKNNDCNIVTGYALLEKIWFSHTWVIKPKKKILIEQLDKNRQDKFRYFGYVLSQKECENFYYLYKDDIIHYQDYEENKDTLPKDMTFAQWMKYTKRRDN